MTAALHDWMTLSRRITKATIMRNRAFLLLAGVCLLSSCQPIDATIAVRPDADAALEDDAAGDDASSHDSAVEAASSPVDGGTLPSEAGNDIDAGQDAVATDVGDGGCACDPSAQYCLLGDYTLTGGRNVARCEARIGDCFDCSCYSQIGLCVEGALPESCTTGAGGLIVVRCAEIP
jgi:hypothetical protein